MTLYLCINQSQILISDIIIIKQVNILSPTHIPTHKIVTGSVLVLDFL